MLLFPGTARRPALSIGEGGLQVFVEALSELRAVCLPPPAPSTPLALGPTDNKRPRSGRKETRRAANQNKQRDQRTGPPDWSGRGQAPGAAVI